jgi:hypothetical protein
LLLSNFFVGHLGKGVCVLRKKGASYYSIKVIEGDKGNFRVFRDKVMGILDESGVMATPANVVGMGDVAPPTRTSTGSGDQFPTLTVGTPAAKTKKKKTEEKPEKRKSSVMSFKDFMGSAKKSQE